MVSGASSPPASASRPSASNRTATRSRRVERALVQPEILYYVARSPPGGPHDPHRHRHRYHRCSPVAGCLRRKYRSDSLARPLTVNRKTVPPPAAWLVPELPAIRHDNRRQIERPHVLPLRRDKRLEQAGSHIVGYPRSAVGHKLFGRLFRKLVSLVNRNFGVPRPLIASVETANRLIRSRALKRAELGNTPGHRQHLFAPPTSKHINDRKLRLTGDALLMQHAARHFVRWRSHANGN
jgi:hypothetical protein